MMGKKLLFLDSADPNEIQRVLLAGCIHGVTTNPSLWAKTERMGDGGGFEYYLNCVERLLKLMQKNFYDGDTKHLSVEVVTIDPDEMYKQAQEIWNLFKLFRKKNCAPSAQNKIDLHVKVPVTVDTLSVITKLEKHNIKVNATACMIADQAMMAQESGASVVSFFYNRMKDGGLDADMEIQRFKNDLTPVFDGFSDGRIQNKSFVICGSIRQPSDVYRCWESGADAVTVPMKIIELMMTHPQTDLAIKRFQEDIDGWLGKSE